MMRTAKRILSLLFAVLLVMALAGCSTSEDVPEAADGDRTEQFSQVCVDVGTDDGGYYAMFSDGEIGYYQDEIAYIYLNDPTLIAFNVSDVYDGGVCTISGAEMAAIIEMLEAVKSMTEDDAVIEKINEVIAELENHPALTSAST